MDLKYEIQQEVNDLYSSISKKIHYERFHWIHDLYKSGEVKMKVLTEVTGYTKQRLYQIFAEIEQNEDN